MRTTTAQHVAALEQMCLDIELRGGAIEPLTPSFMLPLRRRSTSTECDRRAIAVDRVRR